MADKDIKDVLTPERIDAAVKDGFYSPEYAENLKRRLGYAAETVANALGSSMGKEAAQQALAFNDKKEAPAPERQIIWEPTSPKFAPSKAGRDAVAARDKYYSEQGLDRGQVLDEEGTIVDEPRKAAPGAEPDVVTGASTRTLTNPEWYEDWMKEQHRLEAIERMKQIGAESGEAANRSLQSAEKRAHDAAQLKLYLESEGQKLRLRDEQKRQSQLRKDKEDEDRAARLTNAALSLARPQPYIADRPSLSTADVDAWIERIKKGRAKYG